MIELAQHIEVLLLESDCVIVPGFGGFVAHYAPATHIKEENCGIKKAIEEGKISKERYERYCKIYEELKEKEKYRW